jgi:hypothetical protein
MKAARKKTLMCAYYIKGHCHDGTICPFAHGTDELGKEDDNFKLVLNQLAP